MANTFLGLDTPNIAAGWGPAPQLHAAPISGVLGEILQQRRYQEALTQKNIADTIKQFQSQRQSQAYLEAMQKAGILPEGDYGALGAEGASDLAKQILAKKVADARTEHLTKMEARLSAGGGGRGRGGGGGTSEPETRWDAQGREWRPGPGGRWIPVKPAPGTKADVPKLSPTEKGWAAPEIPGLSVNINAPDEPAQTLQPNVPPMPTGDPGAPPPADQNLAPGYGTQATYMKAPDGTVSPVDPNLVEYYKSKGAVIVAGP